MSASNWFGLALVAVVLAVMLEAWLKRGKHRPLSHSRPEREQPKKPDLGMEATDAEAFNRSIRVNEGFMAKTSVGGKYKSWMDAYSQPAVEPKEEDETYAARYYNAHGPKEKNE